MQIKAYFVIKFRKYKLSKAKGWEVRREEGARIMDLNQDIAIY